MEEKLTVLGAFEGLLFLKQWNVQSSAIQNNTNTKKTKKKSVQNRKNVRKTVKNNKNLLINQDIEVWNDPKPNNHKVKEGEELKQDIPLESCWKMDLKSETDIPQNNNLVMNANCDKKILDSKEKTEDSSKSIKNPSGKHIKLIKENSFDDTSEEIESNESDEVNQEIINKEIPLAVQEWVNHLPLKDRTSSKEVANSEETKDDSQGASSEENPAVRAQLSREASLQSSSSLDSILDSRRPDPVEIFLNLGFGGLPGVDTENCRIPKRFLVPSKCKGGDWNEFLRRELLQAQNFECSSLGFRGLSGPSYRRPSAIVANIMEKLRERAVPQPHNRSRFSAVAKMVLNEKSVLNKLTPEFQSVLSPDSRKFLQNQGKKSPEVPRRRIIFGQKSFAFAHDGEFVEVESSNVDEKTTKDSSANDVEESPVFPNADVLLKLRRSSLQKQKKVEEDTDDVDDVFYVVSNKEHSTESSYSSNTNSPSNSNTSNNDDDNNNNNSNNNKNNDNNNNNDCSKKAGKIPQRFLSSTNLKALEENNLSQALRLEVEKEIMNLSQKIKSISNQDLPSVLQQVKELRSKIENSHQE